MKWIKKYIITVTTYRANNVCLHKYTLNSIYYIIVIGHMENLFLVKKLSSL